jgi:hypothetical protein
METPRWTKDSPAVKAALRQLETELSSPALGKALHATATCDHCGSHGSVYPVAHGLLCGTCMGEAEQMEATAPVHTDPTTHSSFGREIPPSQFGPRGIIAAPERSAAGNLVLRCGNENDDGNGWHQVAHVVMTPDEARRFLAECQRTLEER